MIRRYRLHSGRHYKHNLALKIYNRRYIQRLSERTHDSVSGVKYIDIYNIIPRRYRISLRDKVKLKVNKNYDHHYFNVKDTRK